MAGAIVSWIVHETGRGSERDPGRVCPDKLDTDRGVSDPARRACADPDAREAGSLTPHSNPILSFCGRPGRQKTPADFGSGIGASRRCCGTSQVALAAAAMRRRGRCRGDDDEVRGADGEKGLCPPPRPPLELGRDPNQVKEASRKSRSRRTKDDFVLCGSEIVRQAGPGERSGDANQGREMTVRVREYQQLDLARAAVQR